MGACGSTQLPAPNEKKYRRAIKLYEVDEVRSMTNLLNRNKCFDSGELPLTLAADEGHEAVVQALVKAGADVNLLDKSGRCALNIAVNIDDPETVDILLAAKANPNRYDSSSMTPLQAACKRGRTAIARKLLDAGADPNECERSLPPLLHALNNDHQSCVELLLSRGAKSDVYDSRGNTALFLAVSNNNFSCVKSLVRHGADTNLRNHHAESVLSLASVTGLTDILSLLLENGCDANRLEEEDVPPLIGAAIKGNNECLELLLAFNCDAEKKDKKNRTALYVASMAVVDVDRGLFFSKYFSNLYRNYSKFDPLDVIAENLTKCAMTLVQAGADLRDAWSRFVHVFPSKQGVTFEQMVLCEVFIQSFGFKDVHFQSLRNFCVNLLSSREYGLVKLLYSAGVDPEPEDLYILSGQSDEVDRVMFIWVKKLRSQPRQLKDLCRKRIRHLLSWNVLYQIEKLQIADNMKEYICIMDTEHYSQAE